MKILGIALGVLLFLTGCGYKPLSHYARESLGNRLYVDMEVSLRDPENSVLLKDALSRAVLTRLHGKLAPKESADSTIKITLHSVQFSSLADNKEGFTTFYRAHVVLGFLYEDARGERHTYHARGKHDFSIDDSSIISDSKRLEAIRNASVQAIDSFISYIAIKGAGDVKP